MTAERGDYQRGRGWYARQAIARQQLADDKALAETVACPPKPLGCSAAAGHPCVTRRSGRRAEPLKHFPAHASRLNAARKATR